MQFFWKKMKKDQKGFTLVELMVVVVILGILATLSVQAIGDKRTQAEQARDNADLRTIISALELYVVDGNSYPEGTNSTDALNVLEPDYIKELPDYTYTNDTTNTEITITVGTTTRTIDY
ncbi:MAG: ral secretion pathway protein [Clostridia bacterium]|jgi:type II secretion system protein G|nr:ral secretion pathway protein [Clostridia bacterium]MDN5323713.1 ral secretion pathway protein [Clostridia bacterium]